MAITLLNDIDNSYNKGEIILRNETDNKYSYVFLFL